jgi:hypothetical protein
MSASDWQAWLDSLPSTHAQLHELHVELAQQVVVTETQWRAALWSDDRRQLRVARRRLTELNCQLLAIQTRVQGA